MHPMQPLGRPEKRWGLVAGSPIPSSCPPHSKTSLEESLGLFFVSCPWKWVLTPVCGLRPPSQSRVSGPGLIPLGWGCILLHSDLHSPGPAAQLPHTHGQIYCRAGSGLSSGCSLLVQKLTHAPSRGSELSGTELRSCKPSLHKPRHHPP